MKYEFTHQLPINSKKAKRGFIGLSVLILLCIAGMVISEMLWDEYTYPVRRLGSSVIYTGGWPATVFNWGLWLLVATVIFMPMMYFMQDWKNPSLGITADGLFINQQLMRNTFVPFSNIKMITQEGNKYKIIFNDPSQVVNQQIFLFKPLVKSNLKMGNFFISDLHTAGNVGELMNVAKSKLKA